MKKGLVFCLATLILCASSFAAQSKANTKSLPVKNLAQRQITKINKHQNTAAMKAHKTARQEPLTEQARRNLKLEQKDLVKQVKAAQKAGHDFAALKTRWNAIQKQLGHPFAPRRSLDQGGETCADALAIPSLPYSDTGTTIGAQDNYDGGCFSSGSPDVVYSYTPSVDQSVVISLAGSNFDTGLHIWDGCPDNGGTEVGCNDDTYGLQSCVQVDVAANETYFIIVDGYGGDAGNYLINVYEGTTCYPLGGGDNCQDATVIPSIPYSSFGFTNDASDDYVGPCVDDAAGNDVVYSYTPTADQTVTISTAGSDIYNAALHVWDGCPDANGENVACAQGYYYACTENLLLLAGHTYYVIVDGEYGDSGYFQLSISTSPYCVPGDLCENALPIGSLPFQTSGYTGYYNDDYHGYCGDDSGPDLVFTYTPTTSQAVTISSLGSDFNTVLSVWQGCPTQRGLLLNCNDDYIGQQSCIGGIYLSAGVTYYIVLDGNDGDYGDYVLNVHEGTDCLPVFTPPFTTSGNTCDQGSDMCQEDNGYYDVFFVVNIPTDGMYTFSMCDTSNLDNWDSYMTLSSTPCGEPIAENDDACDALSEISCAQLSAGIYYLEITGYDYEECGSYTLKGYSCSYNGCACQNEENTVCVEPAAAVHDTSETDVVINVPTQYEITDVNVCLNIFHTYDSDLVLVLESPSGTQVLLSNEEGGSGFGYLCTTFDDSSNAPIWDGEAPFSGSYMPESPLAAFNGENAQGNWILRVYDTAEEDTGLVNLVCLSFQYDRILAVELNSFTAIPGDNAVGLNWSTASETNNARFEIQRDNSTVASIPAVNAAHSYSWTDNRVQNGRTYNYALVAVDVNGKREQLRTLSATPNSSAAVVNEYALHQNYPNPFNPSTQIVYDLKEAGFVSLKVYNLLGQNVATLVNGSMEQGRHSLTFDATNLPSGLYLYRLNVNGFQAEQKMLLMK